MFLRFFYREVACLFDITIVLENDVKDLGSISKVR